MAKRKPADAGVKGSYIVRTRVAHDDGIYEAGETIELDADDALELIACGALELIACGALEPPEEPADKTE